MSDLNPQPSAARAAGAPSSLPGEQAPTTDDLGARPPAPAETFPRPFGRYELRALLGRGGMGTVYLAHDPHLDRPVALKVPRPVGDDIGEWHHRFRTEARAAATLQHPNICPVFEVGEVDHQPYLTMAYIEGETLAERLKRTGPVPVDDGVRLVRAVAGAMAEAHERGIVHRDLKPANVMLDRREQPVVMDFGLALRPTAADDLRLTLSGVAVGTPAYMPPEQAGGDNDAVGPHSDVYSLGVILYELVTGRTPFQGRTFGKLLAQIERDSPPLPSGFNPKVDDALDAVLLTALEKGPQQRFANAGGLADVLDAYLRGEKRSIAAQYGDAVRRSATPPDVGGARKRRSRVPAVAAAALGLLLVVLLGVVIYVQTDKGELVVELSDPNAAVDVKVNGQEVVLDPNDKAIRIRAGQNQKLEVSGPDFETTSESFDLKRGGKRVVGVTLRPRVAGAAAAPEKHLSKPVAFPKAATLVELPGWHILADATKDEVQSWLDERKKAKHSVLWLDVAQVGNTPYYCAVSALDARANDWFAFPDLPAAEINNVDLLFQRVGAQTLQVDSLSSFSEKNDLRSAALVRRGSSATGSLGILPLDHARLSLPNYNKLGAVRLFRPSVVGEGQLRSAVYVENVVEPKTPPAIDLSADALEARLTKCRGDGQRPISLSAYVSGGQLLFALTVRENDKNSSWEASKNLTAGDLKARATALVAQGFTPASMTVYPWDGAVRYCVVWAKEPPEKK